jgi:hypothetical protein
MGIVEYLRFYLLMSCEAKFRDLKAYVDRIGREIEVGHETEDSDRVKKKMALWEEQSKELENICDRNFAVSTKEEIEKLIQERWPIVLENLRGGGDCSYEWDMNYFLKETRFIKEKQLFIDLFFVRREIGCSRSHNRCNTDPLYLDALNGCSPEDNVNAKILFDMVENKLYDPNKVTTYSSPHVFWGRCASLVNRNFTIEYRKLFEAVFTDKRTDYYADNNGCWLPTFWVSNCFDKEFYKPEVSKFRLQLLSDVIKKGQLNILTCDYQSGVDHRESLLIPIFKHIDELKNNPRDRNVLELIKTLVNEEVIDNQINQASCHAELLLKEPEAYIEIIKQFSQISSDKQKGYKSKLYSLDLM